MIYFDHNATAPMFADARDAWLDATDQFIGNPSSPHRLGSRAERALNLAREKLARFLQCDPLDIVWTSGATEASNLVLHHFAASSPHDSEIWISATEHPCVLEAARYYFPQRLRLIPSTRSGVADLNWISERLKKAPPLGIAVMAANNEIGVLQPWTEVLRLCREGKIPFFCDATQWIGKLPAAGLGACDFVSGSAHKFGGPKGVGFLKCSSTDRTIPLLLGGKQEEGRRAGTENVPGVLALLAALEARESILAKGGSKQRVHWRDKFVKFLKRNLPGTVVLGAGQLCLWNTVSALMPARDCQPRWVVKLDKLGFAVSTGSACASGREEPSHVLSAMGYTSQEAGRVLRFSSGWETTEAEWMRLAEALLKVAKTEK